MESLPLMELSSLVKDIHAKTREASQNTDLDMRGFLRIGKTLQIIQSDLVNNPPTPSPPLQKNKKQKQKQNKKQKKPQTTEIDERIKKGRKKLKKVKSDPTYSEEERQLYKDRLDDLNTKKQARLEILSQSQKDLQALVVRIKQTLEKILDKNTSLGERNRTLLRNQGCTIVSVLTALSMTISAIVLAIWRRKRRRRRFSIKK